MKFVLIISVFVIFMPSFGQLSTPLVGTKYITAKKENFSGFLGQNSIGLFTADYIYYSRRKQELIVRQFRKGDLQLVDSKNIYSQIQDGYTNEPEEIFFQNGKFFLFSKLSSERDKTKLLALEVFNELPERVSCIILDTLRTDEIQYIEESESQDGFILAKHLRHTQIVEQEIKLSRINSQGDLLWKRSIRSPMALQNLRIEQIRFAKNSPIYVLCNYGFDLGENGSSVDQFVKNKYALWAFDEEHKFLKEFEIRIKNKWVNGIDMKINERGKLILSGYFNETKSPSINGVFFMKINQDLKLSNTAWHKFKSTTLGKFQQKENDNYKKMKELDNYQMKNLLVMDNGSFFIVGEQYHEYIERNYDPRTNVTTKTEHYNYNSIIVSRFDSLGNHKWTDRIPKVQNSTNDFGYFSSFAAMNSGDALYLFFNDAKKNNENPPKGYFDYTNLFNNRGSQISYVHISANGVEDRGALLSDKYEHLMRARLCRQLSSEAIYLITEIGRSSKIIKVGLKN